MAHRMVILPTGPALSQVLLQNISRISGAFVENASFKGLENTENPVPSVLITARSSRNAYTAERLVQRAAMEVRHLDHHLSVYAKGRTRPHTDLVYSYFLLLHQKNICAPTQTLQSLHQVVRTVQNTRCTRLVPRGSAYGLFSTHKISFTTTPRIHLGRKEL